MNSYFRGKDRKIIRDYRQAGQPNLIFTLQKKNGQRGVVTAVPLSLPPGTEEAVREYGNILFCECYKFINIILWKLRLLKQARIWN